VQLFVIPAKAGIHPHFRQETGWKIAGLWYVSRMEKTVRLPDEDVRLWGLLGVMGAAAVAAALWAPSAFRLVLLCFCLAYVFNPVVTLLEKRVRVPRSISAGLILLLALFLVAVALELVIPYLLMQLESLLQAAPDLLTQALERLRSWGIVHDQSNPRTFEELAQFLRAQVSGKEASVIPTLAGYLFRATRGAVGILLLALNLVLIPIFFFLILEDMGRLRRGLLSLVHPSRHEGVERYLANVNRIFGSFLRGQLIVGGCLAVIYGFGLYLTGLRFGLTIGIITGILSMIPYVGFALGIFLAGIVTLVDFSGWGQAAAVAGVFALGQAIETYGLTPRIVGNKVGLNPVESLMAILVFAEMGGFLGLILALPLGGIIKYSILLIFNPREG
jgi:predicted PurR-regulated permease PerM